MSTDRVVNRNFYERDTVEVARDLLGKYLRRISSRGEPMGGMITEVEAYLPFIDEAAHNFKGKTERNAVLFERAGLAYVHSIHRYYCIDVVTEFENIPGSVLIRSIEPEEGVDIMKVNRSRDDVRGLTNGPGKICQALSITREQNWTDLTDPNSEIVLLDRGVIINENEIQVSTRIGISKATDKLLRFYLK